MTTAPLTASVRAANSPARGLRLITQVSKRRAARFILELRPGEGYIDLAADLVFADARGDARSSISRPRAAEPLVLAAQRTR